MAKFSDFQDLNKDGLVDKCVVDLPIREDPCPTCIPNPHALRTDWTKKTHLESYLNERTCEYVIVFRSNYTNTGGIGDVTRDEQEIINRWEQYKLAAVKEILEAYAKEATQEVTNRVASHVTYHKKDWNLSVVPNSRMKFKYRVPAEVLNAVPEAPQDQEMPSAPIEIEFEVNELNLTLIRISKGLHLYSRYVKVYQVVEGGKVLFANSGARFDLVPYGDKTGKLRTIIPELLKFFWSKGWVLNGSLLPGFGKKDAEKIVFGFNSNYTLNYITVWQSGCKHNAYTVKGGQLNALKNKAPFNDSTAMAFLSKANEMENDLISRVPKDWLQFLEEYTYPPLNISYARQGDYDPLAPGEPLQQQAMNALDCIQDDFMSEINEFTDFVEDQVMSLGDAIAYKFRDKICGTEDSAQRDAEEAGWFSVYDPKTRTNRNVYAMAQEQAFAQLEANDQVFVELCARLFSLLNVSGGYQKMDETWAQVFGPLKICGLSDLLTDVIKCLLGGLGLEEALAKMVLSALNAMGIEDFGKLFVGLPAAKQREMEQLVMRRLQSGDVPGFNPENQRVVPPWESEVAKDEASKRTATGMADNPVPVDRGPPYSAPSTRRTLAQQFDTAVNDPYQGIDPNNILQVYVAALIEVYSGQLLDLADELNKLPGAPIITTIIATLDCPRPPLFDPGLFDWLKDIQLPWCRNNRDISWPRLNMAPPMSLADIFKALIEAAKEAFLELVMNILIAIIVKVCELLGDAICKALEAVGALAAALPSLISGENSISNVLGEVFCGPDAAQEQVQAVTSRLIGQLGGGGAAMANRELVNNWTAGVSSMLTQRELAEVFLGEASDATLSIIHEFTELDVPEFAESLSSPSAIRNLFKNIGDLFPPEFRQNLRNIANADDLLADKPINPSLCATPEKLDDFKAARCALLEGRATKEQCDKLYEDLKDQLLDDLEDISTVFQKGPQAHIADQLPPLISEPGCQDGLFPFEPEEHKVAREAVQDALYKEIKVAFTQDLIGDGPWPWQWGLVNLILSDVNGLAYTSHQRKTLRNNNYVDFIEPEDPDPPPNPLADILSPIDASLVIGQQGAYPVDVAGWLQDYLTSKDYKAPDEKLFSHNTAWKDSKKVKIAIEPNPRIMTALGIGDKNQVTFITLPGYKSGDMKAKFRDNAKGMPSKFPLLGVPESKKGLDNTGEAYGYGFDIYMSISDMEEAGSELTYRDGDWTSLRIYERKNNGFSDMIAANDIFSAFGMGKSLEEKLSGKELGVSVTRVAPSNSRSPHTAIVQEELSADVRQIFNDLPPIEYTKGTKNYSPQIQRLANFLNMKNNVVGNISLDELVQAQDEIMSSFIESVFDTISEGEGENTSFSYGAEPDDLSPEDIMYVNPSDYTDSGGDYHEAGKPYSIPSSEAVMGVSYAQFSNAPTANRIHYLSPSSFGGKYSSPGIYIEPAPNQGWLGIMDALVPEQDGCKPRRADLVNFSDISDRVNDLYTKIPDDPRLRQGPECRLEVPYARILDRASAAGIEGVVMIAIRAFACVHFIKAMATYSKFKPTFPGNFSSIVSSFIIQEMESKFKENDNTMGQSMFKDERFWYAFLEQCVQIYDRKVTLGEVDPPAAAINAFRALNDLQEGYNYPDKSDLRKAKNQDLQYLDKNIADHMHLKRYRNLKNLHFVRDTEMHAKNIMKYLVDEELNKLGEIFSDNLNAINMSPKIDHIGKYFLSKESGMVQGSNLNLLQDFSLSGNSLGLEEASALYTAGGDFLRPDGSDYIGQYHVHIDEARGPVAMVGPYHKSQYHDELIPITKGMTVMGDLGLPLGEVGEFGRNEFSGRGLFKVEKVMRITPKNSSQVDSGISPLTDSPSGLVETSTWELYVSRLPADIKRRNFSDYYGNLEFAFDPQSESEEPIGIKADTTIGVEYGLRLLFGTSNLVVAEAYVDALDGPMSNLESYSESSRILYCLINNLVDSPEFKFITEYVFPLYKATAFVAIYNSQAFLASIGELTAQYSSEADLNGSARQPGRRVDSSGAYDEEGSIRGWEPYAKRFKFQQNNNPSTWLATGFDEWDRETLKSTAPKIRNLFMSYYKSRDFDWGSDGPDGVGYMLEQMRETVRPPAGAKYLPWWMKGRLRKRPMNKNGGMCSSSDED